MDIEEIVARPRLFQGVEEVGRLASDIGDRHAEQLGQPLVHRVVGDGAGRSLKALAWSGWTGTWRTRGGGRRSPWPRREDLGDVAEKPVDRRRGLGGLRRERRRRQRRLALLLRVGVGKRVGQPFGREAGDEAVLLPGKTRTSRPSRLGRRALRSAQMRTFSSVGMRPARRSATSPPRPWRSCRGPRDRSSRPRPPTPGLEDAPAELVLERLVTEEGEVGRPLPGVIPIRTGSDRPQTPRRASPSRFGLRPPRARSGRRRAGLRRRP